MMLLLLLLFLENAYQRLKIVLWRKDSPELAAWKLLAVVFWQRFDSAHCCKATFVLFTSLVYQSLANLEQKKKELLKVCCNV